MTSTFNTYVFYSNDDILKQCIDAGVSGVIIDWERGDKFLRQKQYDTQINSHGLSELETVRKVYGGPITCRINGGDLINETEILKAVELGANEILVPMIKSLNQLEKVIKYCNGSVDIALMLETSEAILLAPELAAYNFSKVYVGLNDLAICNHERNIFLPLIDGTIEKIRPYFKMPFGFAGLTHPDMGNPIPSILLLREMKRLNCNFSFLRRSFFKDLQTYSAKEILDAIDLEFNSNGYDILEHQNTLKMSVQNINFSLI